MAKVAPTANTTDGRATIGYEAELWRMADALRAIERELVTTVRADVTIDWTVRENIRARLRLIVKRILRKHGYPPDKQEKATETVLQQAEILSNHWASEPCYPRAHTES